MFERSEIYLRAKCLGANKKTWIGVQGLKNYFQESRVGKGIAFLALVYLLLLFASSG